MSIMAMQSGSIPPTAHLTQADPRCALDFVALHARHGFRTVGRRERVGKMMHGPRAGEWRDTLLLERRSAVAGQ